MTLTTFLMILIGRKFDLQQRFAIQESFDHRFAQGSNNLIKSVIATTLIFEVTGTIVLFFCFPSGLSSPPGPLVCRFPQRQCF